MRKFRHILTDRNFETELIGHNKIEGIIWGDWQIPMWVVENSNEWEEIKPKVILTTEDGIDLCVGDTYYSPIPFDDDNTLPTVMTFEIVDESPEHGMLKFGKKENAEKYIELTHRKYSLKDIVRVANQISFNKLFSKEDVLNLLEGKENIKLEL